MKGEGTKGEETKVKDVFLLFLRAQITPFMVIKIDDRNFDALTKLWERAVPMTGSGTSVNDNLQVSLLSTSEI